MRADRSWTPTLQNLPATTRPACHAPGASPAGLLPRRTTATAGRKLTRNDSRGHRASRGSFVHRGLHGGMDASAASLPIYASTDKRPVQSDGRRQNGHCSSHGLSPPPGRPRRTVCQPDAGATSVGPTMPYRPGTSQPVPAAVPVRQTVSRFRPAASPYNLDNAPQRR